jgi:hypothetical protein
MLLLAAFAAAVVAGTLHVVTGPDHLAAVAPLAARERDGAWRIGARWGLGHGLASAALGGLAILGRDLIPFDALSGAAERAVGVVLVVVGVASLVAVVRSRAHVHAHAHEGTVHEHVHAHPRGLDEHAHAAHEHSHSALGIGALHGLAGGTHLVGVLPALGLDAGQAAAYLVGFAASSVVVMAAWTAGAGFIGGKLARAPRLLDGFRASAAAAAVVVGCVWIAF